MMEDRCNCFLHSYSYSYEGDTLDLDMLKPFIDYVSTHINTNSLTLIQLKNYAKKFEHKELSFENANWE